MSDHSEGAGWWLASDGRWYPPEVHPDYQTVPPVPPVPPTAGVDTTPAGAATAAARSGSGGWSRGPKLWVLIGGGALAVVIVLILIGVIVGDGDDDDGGGGEVATGAEAVERTPSPSPADAAAPAPVETVTSEPSPPAGAEPPAGEQGCSYAGLDFADDIQVELVFTNPFGAVGQIDVAYALKDGGGVRFATETAFIEGPGPDERFQLRDDTFEDVPDGIDEATIGCEILRIEEGIGGPTEPAGDDASCTVVGTDFASDLQIEMNVTSPFAETTDVQVVYALRGPGGVRFATGSALVELVEPGEVLRVSEDTLSELPDWVAESEAVCAVLGLDSF